MGVRQNGSVGGVCLPDAFFRYFKRSVVIEEEVLRNVVGLPLAPLLGRALICHSGLVRSRRVWVLRLDRLLLFLDKDAVLHESNVFLLTVRVGVNFTRFLSVALWLLLHDAMELEVDDGGVERHHGQGGVLTVELDGDEGGGALERLIDLEEFCLDALELVGVPTHLILHNLGRVRSSHKVVLGRLRVVQLDSQVELVVHELVRLERPVWIENYGHPLRVLV